jgi:hypothetical protein
MNLAGKLYKLASTQAQYRTNVQAPAEEDNLCLLLISFAAQKNVVLPELGCEVCLCPSMVKTLCHETIPS